MASKYNKEKMVLIICLLQTTQPHRYYFQKSMRVCTSNGIDISQAPAIIYIMCYVITATINSLNTCSMYVTIIIINK